MPVVALNDTSALCTSKQLADVLGLTARQVDHLRTEGILRKARGKLHGYKLAESVQAYLRYQRDYVTRKCSINGDQAYNDARSRRMAALAAIEEARAKQITGGLLRRDRVVFVMTNLLSMVKNHMLGMPARCSRRLVGQHDLTKVRTILDEDVRNCLIEAAQFGSHSFDETGRNGSRSDADD
jgi:phage terminase Nu1 subunit (DNA packaging protein)